jgi:hypothetical protein
VCRDTARNRRAFVVTAFSRSATLTNSTGGPLGGIANSSCTIIIGLKKIANHMTKYLSSLIIPYNTVKYARQMTTDYLILNNAIMGGI